MYTCSFLFSDFYSSSNPPDHKWELRCSHSGLRSCTTPSLAGLLIGKQELQLPVWPFFKDNINLNAFSVQGHGGPFPLTLSYTLQQAVIYSPELILSLWQNVLNAIAVQASQPYARCHCWGIRIIWPVVLEDRTLWRTGAGEGGLTCSDTHKAALTSGASNPVAQGGMNAITVPAWPRGSPPQHDSWSELSTETRDWWVSVVVSC